MSKDIFPFELIIKNNEGKELFIDTVEKVLQENLQCKDSFGCSILNCHTHVGSKKHLQKFVEAELLFHNSYYNKGFAFCTVKLLENRIGNYEHVVLIGYETFGELYICETAELLRNSLHKTVEYCIAETIGETFRIRSSTGNNKFMEDAYYVFVVPINTTLTTHDKLVSGYKKWLKCEDTVFDCKNSINIALIIIASKSNNDFWKITDSKERKIKLLEDKRTELSNIGDREVSYFAQIEGQWYGAEECEYCFPDLKGEALTEEQAIFEVNRASVVPMLQLGTEIVSEPLDESKKKEEEQNIIKLILLNRYLIHHHLTRNGNHYQYYFDTQKYFQDVKNLNGMFGLRGWLEEKVKTSLREKNSKEEIVYNFIVSPRHYSNAGFVQYVNDIVFDGTARILYFDVSKEYRGNIKAKYSDLTRLVDNIINSRQPSKLCFHYVDDTILSGANFLRTKNLLYTLVPMRGKDNLCSSSLFESVIILVGRNSIDSKRWYAGNENSFFEYVHLSISPMRNHEDACTLCKMVESYKRLETFCATNKMSNIIHKTIENHNDEKITQFIIPPTENYGEKQARVLLSHLLVERLNNHWWIDKKSAKVVNKEITEDIYYVIKNFYYDICKELKKLLKSYGKETELQDSEILNYNDTNIKVALIKVISRPFFCYHIRQKQAALKFCLNCLDEKLNTLYEIEQKAGERRIICEADKKIIKALVNAIADLNAMYLVRANVISKIMYLIRKRKVLDFTDYCKALKRSVGMSSDDSKCVLLEYILVEKEEKEFFGEDYCSDKLTGVKDDDRLALYLENNSVLVEGFRDIVNNNIDFDIINGIPYYLEKFYKIFEINLKRQNSEIAPIINAYKDLHHCLEVQDPNWDTLKEIVKHVNSLFGDTIIKMFFWDKNEPMEYDGYYLLDERRDIDFYSRINLEKMKKALEIEPILDTIYITSEMCIIKISKNLDVKMNKKEKEREIFFSFECKEPVNENQWFRMKILLTLRNKFVEMLENMNVQNEINKLNTERKKKALGIKKAQTHNLLEYSEGRSEIFRYRQVLCRYPNICDTEGEFDVGETYKDIKRLYDSYILLLTNQFVVDIYNRVIYYPNRIEYKGVRLKDRMEECLSAAGFKEKEGKYIYEIVTPNEYGEKVKVRINCEINSFHNKKFWFFSRREELLPYYYYLIMAFAANAGYHYIGKKSCDFYVKAEGNYMVFSNKISEEVLDEKDLKKIEDASRKKMEIPPWEFEIKEQSITLWSLSRYFQILEKEYEQMRVSDRGRKCPLNRSDGDGILVKIQNNEFIISLKVLELVEDSK